METFRNFTLQYQIIITYMWHIRQACVLYLTIASTFFYSCSTRKETCREADVFFIKFYPVGPGSSFVDTSATLVRYVKGGNFTGIVDSFKAVSVSNSSDHNIFMPGNGTDVYSYDWSIYLFPSGKMYWVKDMKFYSRTITIHENDDHTCTKNLSYTANDSSYYLPGLIDNNSASLSIRY